MRVGIKYARMDILVGIYARQHKGERLKCRGLTELRAGKHGAIIGEADEDLVESGVPQCWE